MNKQAISKLFFPQIYNNTRALENLKEEKFAQLNNFGVDTDIYTTFMQLYMVDRLNEARWYLLHLS